MRSTSCFIFLLVASFVWLGLSLSSLDVSFTTNTAGEITDASFRVQLGPSETVGDSYWDAWTKVVVHLPPYAIGTTAQTRFNGTGLLSVWGNLMPVVVDRVQQTITFAARGRTTVQGPAQLTFTLTSLRLPINCENLGNWTIDFINTNRLTISADPTSDGITGCNDPPTITVATYTDFTEGVPDQLMPSIQISDVDLITPILAQAARLTVTLVASNGTLKPRPPFTVDVIEGSGTSRLALTSSKDSLNIVLGALLFTPDTYFNGPCNITVSVDDRDFSGPGMNKVSVLQFVLNVVAVRSDLKLDLVSPLNSLSVEWSRVEFGSATQEPSYFQVSLLTPDNKTTTDMIHLQIIVSKGSIMVNFTGWNTSIWPVQFLNGSNGRFRFSCCRLSSYFFVAFETSQWNDEKLFHQMRGDQISVNTNISVNYTFSRPLSLKHLSPSARIYHRSPFVVVRASAPQIKAALQRVAYSPDLAYRTDCFVTVSDTIMILADDEVTGASTLNGPLAIPVYITNRGALDTCAGPEPVWKESIIPTMAMQNELMVYRVFGVRAFYYDYGFEVAFSTNVNCSLQQWVNGTTPVTAQRTNSDQGAYVDIRNIFHFHCFIVFTVVFKIAIPGDYFVCYRPKQGDANRRNVTFWMRIEGTMIHIAPTANCSNVNVSMSAGSDAVPPTATMGLKFVNGNISLAQCQAACIKSVPCARTAFYQGECWNLAVEPMMEYEANSASNTHFTSAQFSYWNKTVVPADCNVPLHNYDTCGEFLSTHPGLNLTYQLTNGTNVTTPFAPCGCYVDDLELPKAPRLFVQDTFPFWPTDELGDAPPPLYTGCCLNEMRFPLGDVHLTTYQWGVCARTTPPVVNPSPVYPIFTP